MAALNSIPGITANEMTHLRTAGVNNVNDLWKKLTADQKDALPKLSTDTGIASIRLVELLQVSLREEARQLEPHYLRRHWMDLVVLAGIALFGWAAFFWNSDRAQPRVLAQNDLPAFHEIVATDLDLKAVPAAQRQAELQRYVGLYTKIGVEVGAKITPQSVGANAVNLSGMELLRVALKLPPVDGERRTPYAAKLVVSPNKTPQTEVSTEADAIVLAYEKDPAPQVVVALRPDQLAIISPLIGSSTAYLVQPPL